MSAHRVGLATFFAAAAAIACSQATAAPAGLEMEVLARAAVDAGGQSKVFRVDGDSALRTGDGIQVRLRVSEDAYVYVIHFGSSRSAVLLHPFSGRDEDALVRAGELRAIPSTDGFLLLDRRTGIESLYAIASPAPLEALSRLMVRMEARGADREAVTQTVREAYPNTLALNFGHDKAAAPPPSASAASAPAISAAFQGGEEQGVLSAEGSRIQAFVSGKPLEPEEPAAPVPSAESPPQPAPPPEPAESVGWLGKLFNLGGTEPDPAAAAEPAEPATTFALPPAAGEAAEPQETAAATGTQAVGSAPGPGVASPAAKAEVETSETAAPEALPPTEANPQINVAALDAIFASLDQPTEAAESAPSEATASGDRSTQSAGAGKQPGVESAAPSSAAANPTRQAEQPAAGLAGTLGTLLEALAPTTESPEQVAAAAAEALPEAQIQLATDTESAPSGAPPVPEAEPVSASPAGKVESTTSDAGGLFSRLFGGPSPPAAADEPPGAESQTDSTDTASTSSDAGAAPTSPANVGSLAATQETGSAGQIDAPASTVVIGPKRSDAGSEKTVVIGPAVAPGPTAAAPASEEASVSAPALEQKAAVGTEKGPAETAAKSSSSGLFSGLAGWFSGAASTEPQASEASPPIEPAEPDIATPVPAAEAPAVEAPAVAEASPAGSGEAPAETTPETGSSGLFGGFASLFSSAGSPPADTSASETRSQVPAQDSAPRSPVVTAPVASEPSANEATETAAADDTGSGGIFGGLARLFGGSESSSQTPASEAQAGGSGEAELPKETQESPPAFKKVTRSDGQTVVILQGPPGRPDAPPAGSSDVLAAEGSKIRALLDPQPDPPAATTLAASPPAQTAAAETLARPIQSATGSPAAAPSLTASTRSPATTSPPAAVSVAPDEVQAALAAGAAPATRPAAETLAALTAPAAAPGLELAPVAEIDVTADDNVSSSIVLVVTPTGTGSGVLLDDAGHVLVNWHVVTGYAAVSVSFKAANAGLPSSERTFRARVVRLNKTADLALLRIDEPPDDLVPVRFADASQIQPGDVLHAIGHPASGAWTHTLGKISNVKPESSWYAGRNLLHRGTVLQAKVLDDPGSAGAPLFNNRLELVGISALSRSKKGMLTGVSVETIRLFLEAPPPGS